jgi:hypothetical protein
MGDVYDFDWLILDRVLGHGQHELEPWRSEGGDDE